MKLADFPSLAEAKAHPVTEGQGRMISPDMMVAFLVKNQILRAVMAEQSEAAEGVRIGLQFGTEFNLIQGHESSVEELLDGIAAATDAFKATCLAYANPTVYPFAKATQADFDKAKLEVNPTHVEASYSSNDHLANTVSNKHTAYVDITEALPFDDVITITASSAQIDIFAKESQARGFIIIPANQTGRFSVEKQINKSGLRTKVKYFLTSKYNRQFTALAEIAAS